MVSILILTVINFMNVTMVARRLNVFAQLVYFSVQLISTVIGQPMSSVQILAPMIPIHLHLIHLHQIPQHLKLQHQIQRHQIQRHRILQHQTRQHQIPKHQLVVKLMTIFVKINQMVFILLRTVPSITNVITVA